MDQKTYQNDELARTSHAEAVIVNSTDAIGGNPNLTVPLVFMGYSAICMLHCAQRLLRLEGWCLGMIKESLVLFSSCPIS